MQGPEGRETHEQIRILLKYTKENWSTHEKTPVEIVFSGPTRKDVYYQATKHMVELEMDDATNIATEARVVENDQEVSWHKWEHEVRYSQ